jgi:hypothetical protein
MTSPVRSYSVFASLCFFSLCPLCLCGSFCFFFAAELESRQLTHYIPQNDLETIVRKEDWTEVPLAVKGGTLKGDTVRVWAGGLIDRGNGDQPGENVNGADGHREPTQLANDQPTYALSPDPAHTYALLFKTESAGPVKCIPPGKPLEIKLTKDKEKLWIGFNDEKGRYQDNHLGKGRRHELDPLWVRVEVVRTTVD